ncbi:hypothetical protein X797_009878 [Metarhizium robertsii]|uniref:F-box domain-containing protein n=1 Tax=Metarhizium robertsii TaxID=568076 RepID=A0A0A1UNP6_9HYPO|nr:hypothetical protein X797_009878 [Metarhizium robertsii]
MDDFVSGMLDQMMRMPPEVRDLFFSSRETIEEENFQLIAPNAKLFRPEKVPVHTLLFQEWSRALVCLLAVPVPQPDLFQVPDERGSQDEARFSIAIQRGSRIMGQAVKPISGHVATILDLPTEIILQVFKEVDCMKDLICLGLARRSFWAIARQRLHDYYMSLWGKWAGENIVYVGEYTQPGDEQKMELCIRDASIRLYEACKNRDKSHDPAFKLAYSEIVCEDSTYFPENESWILRNLTTKEFIRSEAIAIKPEYIHGPFIEYLGFHEVIVSRASWSTFSPTAMADPTEITRGVWAGHRFDITTLARHNLDPQATEWRDVSEEVAKEIASIWRDNHGPNWRKKYVQLKKCQQADFDLWRGDFD